MPFSWSSRTSAVISAAALLALVVACGGKRPPALAGAAPNGAEQGAAADAAPPTPTTRPLDEGPDVRAIEGEGASGTDIGGAAAAGGAGGPLVDIHFEYDSAELTDTARALLEKHALWLQSQRGVQLTIEGHCDERGTVEYNLALSDQRARAARDYLASLGVEASRLRVVSYGKERPLDPGNTEAAYARNRRAHFEVR